MRLSGRPWRIGSSVTLLLLAGCATQPPPADTGPGLLAGLLHGALAIPMLAASLVTEARIYAFPNAGFLYDLGFCAGFSVTLAGLLLAALPYVGGYFVRKG